MSDAEDFESKTYRDWKADIRTEIEANEGHDAPDAEELWHRARHSTQGAAGWISDMPVSEDEIRTAKGDILKALVALELAEERLQEDDEEGWF